MKRIWLYVIFCAMMFSACNHSGNIQNVECNSLDNTKLTVIPDIHFGETWNSVLNSLSFDTFSLYISSAYAKDTCYSFVSLFFGVPARFYLTFREGRLRDIQLREPYSGYLSSLPADTLIAYENRWLAGVTSIYGLGTKIYFDKRGAYYWVWHICNGPTASVRSLNVMNSE